MSERALLWGIDGELAGNEDRLMARLPILRFESDNRLAVARTRQWSRAAERTLTWLASEEQAEEAGTRLDLSSPLRIESGQVVAVVGQRFRIAAHMSCKQWFPHLVDTLSCHDVTPAWVRDNLLGETAPSAWPLSVESYDAIAVALAISTRRAFDALIQNASHGHVPVEAEAALAVLRGTPGARLDDQIVRQLVLSKLQREMDRYRRTLELAALRLGEPSERIERWANEMLPLCVSHSSSAVLRNEDLLRIHDTPPKLDVGMSPVERFEAVISIESMSLNRLRDAARLTDDPYLRKAYDVVARRHEVAIKELYLEVAKSCVDAALGV